MSLRKVSSQFPNPKYSWCNQLQLILNDLGFNRVYETNSFNLISICRPRIIGKFSQNLRSADRRRAVSSSYICNYVDILNCPGTQWYLRRNLPTYLVTCIAQVRLQSSVFYNKGNWHNYGAFKSELCKFCGEENSFLHIFSCTDNFSYKQKYLPVLPEVSMLELTKRLKYDLNLCKNLYYFITSVASK